MNPPNIEEAMRRASRGDGAAADIVNAEVERLRAALRDWESCVVCEALLIPHDGPMHCEDCIVDDEHYYAWQERRGATSAKPDGA